MMKEICGLKQSESLGYYDQDTASLKTFQVSLIQDTSAESLQTFPKHGMMSNGVLSELMTLELRTEGRGCGYWPTPNCMDSVHSTAENHKRKMLGPRKGRTTMSKLADLPHCPEMWPTPTKCGNYNRKGVSKTSGDGLATRVKSLGGTKTQQTYPTPRQFMYKDSLTDRGKSNLGEVINEKEGMKKTGQLNPNWVEWLMNWPIKWTSLERMESEHFEYWKKASAEGIQRPCGVREMWWDNDLAETPLRWGHNEQCQREHFCSVCSLSRKPSCKPEVEESQKRKGMFELQTDIPIQEKQGDNMQPELCEQAGMEKAEIIPRVAIGVKDRVHRLKAIGNGQIPAVVETAWKILTSEVG